MKRDHLVIGLFASLAVGSSAFAGATTLLAVHGTTLYSYDTGSLMTSTFALPDDLTSLARSPDGRLYGSSRTDNDNDGFFEVYRLHFVGGVPSLSLVGDFLDENTPTMSFVGSTLYGVQEVPGGGGPEKLVTIDLGAKTQSLVGATGQIGLLSNGVGSGYDAMTDTFYLLEKGNPAEVHTVNYVPAPDPTHALLGSAGVPSGNGGMEFFDGTLWAVYKNFQNDQFILGTISTGNGAFSQITVLDTPLTNEPIGLGAIPTPGTLALLGMSGLVAIRRRR